MRDLTKVQLRGGGFFLAATKDKELNIDIYGDIGADWFGEGITAGMVSAAVKAAGKFDSIVLNINSPGGDAFEGIAIRNLLAKTGKPITAEIDGIAASAASIIAMAGSDIVMRAGSMLMIHNAWTVAAGDASDFRKMADTLEKINDAVADCYTQQTGMSSDEVKTLMASETWLTAEDALASKFCTRIEKDDKPAALALAKTFKTLAKLRNVPESLKAAVSCACGCANCLGGDCANCSNQDCMDEACMDCPMQQSDAGIGQSSNLSLYQAKAKLLTLHATH